jgi:sulfate adenylyltransferase (ADP) / ATP adenylyltransferase
MDRDQHADRVGGIERLESGTLWSAVRARTEEALRSGALQPLLTERRTVHDEGIPFVVRILTSLDWKATARSSRGAAGGNPFLPPDPALTVGAVSASHLCVLNKFTVFEHHFLIATRDFQPQQSPLDARDFFALAACLAEVDGLGFYNAGTAAGASQEHKHLQIVPWPLGEETASAPIEIAFDGAEPPGTVARPTRLRFDHAFVRFGETAAMEPAELGMRLLQAYEALCRFAEVDCARHPYNLLATRRWAMLVPRSRNCFEGISVNALGFAGSLLVRNRAQLELLARTGPMSVLAAVAGRQRAESHGEGGCSSSIA